MRRGVRGPHRGNCSTTAAARQHTVAAPGRWGGRRNGHGLRPAVNCGTYQIKTDKKVSVMSYHSFTTTQFH